MRTNPNPTPNYCNLRSTTHTRRATRAHSPHSAALSVLLGGDRRPSVASRAARVACLSIRSPRSCASSSQYSRYRALFPSSVLCRTFTRAPPRLRDRPHTETRGSNKGQRLCYLCDPVYGVGPRICTHLTQDRAGIWKSARPETVHHLQPSLDGHLILAQWAVLPLVQCWDRMESMWTGGTSVHASMRPRFLLGCPQHSRSSQIAEYITHTYLGGPAAARLWPDDGRLHMDAGRDDWVRVMDTRCGGAAGRCVWPFLGRRRG